MKHLFSLAAIIALAACLTGCVQSDTIVSVNPDGSGEINLRLMMSQQALAMAKQQDPEGAADPFTEEKMKEIAGALGEVEYKSHEKIDANGYSGVAALYTFKDISKVTFSPGAGMDGQDEDAKPEEGFRFAFAQADGGSTLTVLMPVTPKEEPAEGEEAAPAADDAAPAAELTPQEMQMLTMMKAQMAGLLVSYRIKVKGEVTKTNAKLPVEGEPGTYELIRMDMNKMDVKALAELQKSEGTAMFGTDTPGLRAEEEGKKIEISFK